MYKSIIVDNFRTFSKLDFSDLIRINLTAGKNNVGKTSLLEAIFLLSVP
jgi:AAA15 family ATPase/GTPase